MQIGQEMRWIGNPSLDQNCIVIAQIALYRERARASKVIKEIDFAKYKYSAMPTTAGNRRVGKMDLETLIQPKI